MTRYNKGRLSALVIGIAVAISVVGIAHAQEAVSGSASAAQAGAQAASGSASLSGVVINQTSPSKVTTAYEGTYRAEIKSAPAVSAPAVFGGGHPCLAGKSGGISVIGGGASYGQGDAEPICMLWIMGQPEAAIRLLARQNAAACDALANVGYYRVGNKVLPFGGCGKVVKGGIDTPGSASRTTTISSKSLPWKKCAYDRASNKLVIKYKHGTDKAAVKTQCLAAHGF